MKLFSKKTPEQIKNEKFLFSFKEYVSIYENKKGSYFLNEFLNGEIQKRNKKIKFRKNGDVDYNEKSREPFFVNYNNTWLEIREFIRTTKPAPNKNYYEFTGNFCGNLWDAFKEDGFDIYLMKEENEMGHRHCIPMVSYKPWTSTN